MRAYNNVLRALLRLKRVEAGLCKLWSVLHKAGRLAGGTAQVACCRAFMRRRYE